MSTCKGHPQRPQIRKTTLRLVAVAATALALVLCTRATVASPTASTNLRAGTAAAAAKQEQDLCATRIEKRRGLGIPGDREQCAAVLPASVVKGDSKWLVSVHVDRAPSPMQQPGKRLRGAAQGERCVRKRVKNVVRAKRTSLLFVRPSANKCKIFNHLVCCALC